MPRFSELLNAALRASKISATQLAERCGCSAGALSEARTGKDGPVDSLAIEMAKHLGITDEQDLSQWLVEAARQRAKRSDIAARASERRLAERLEQLEVDALRGRLIWSFGHLLDQTTLEKQLDGQGLSMRAWPDTLRDPLGDLDRLAKVAAALQVPVEFLLEGRNPPGNYLPGGPSGNTR